MQPLVLSEIPAYRTARASGPASLVEWTDHQHRSVGPAEFETFVNRLIPALAALGLGRGDHLCLQIEAGRIDLLAVEFAALSLGAVVCPLHPLLFDDALSAILHELRPVITLVPDAAQRRSLISAGLEKEAGQIVTATELLGHEPNEPQPPDAVSPDDAALIIYTSGTTGDPKGVMLSHRAVLSNVVGALAIVPLESHHVVLSFLPVSHVFERIVIYTYLLAGVTIHFAATARHARVLLNQVHPHYLTTVPRILEQVYRTFVSAATRGNYFRASLVQWALNPGRHGLLRRLLTRWLIARRVRRVFGRRLKGVLVGGAATDTEVIRFFKLARIAVREGYGLTECGGVATVNRFSPGGNLPGTVGIPLPGVEIRIEHGADSQEGEILIRSPGNMSGYLRRPVETRSVLTSDGWLRTGDIGVFVHERFLQITSRAKDIFKNSFGEYVIPMRIEQQLNRSPFVDQVIAIGFQRPFTAALILPEFGHLQQWCQQSGVHWTAPMYMVHNPEVLELYQSIIDKVNPALARHERIGGFRLIHDLWSVESGLLTLSLKLRRVAIEQRYSKLISEIYK